MICVVATQLIWPARLFWQDMLGEPVTVASYDHQLWMRPTLDRPCRVAGAVALGISSLHAEGCQPRLESIVRVDHASRKFTMRHSRLVGVRSILRITEKDHVLPSSSTSGRLSGIRGSTTRETCHFRSGPGAISSDQRS
jgi:hypothetical protein